MIPESLTDREAIEQLHSMVIAIQGRLLRGCPHYRKQFEADKKWALGKPTKRKARVKYSSKEARETA